MVLVLIFGLFAGETVLFSVDNKISPLEKLFRWASMDYQAGKFRDVIKNLELLLSYIDEDDQNQSRELKGKTFLLLGASYECIGNLKRAKEYYRSSVTILDKFTKKGIEDIDLNELKGYREVILHQEQNPTKATDEKQKETKILGINIVGILSGMFLYDGVGVILFP